MYEATEGLDFKAWTGFFYAKRLFERNALTDIAYLTIDEWNTLLSEETFNQPLLALIDNLYMPTVEEVAEAAKRR